MDTHTRPSDIILHQLYPARLEGIFGGLIHVVHLQLAEDILLVGDDGVGIGATQGGDLLHALAGGNQPQDLPLGRG